MDVRLSSTVYMPRWTKPKRVPPELVTWWKKVVAHIAWHEGQHIAIQKRWIAKLEDRVEGKSCDRAQGIINDWSKDAKAAQRAFDRKDAADYSYPRYTGPGGWDG